MATPMQRVGKAGRTGVAALGAVVGAFAFFDGIFLGAPIALLAATFKPLVVYGVATIVVILLVIACCSWVDRRWDEWFSGNGKRIEGEARRDARKPPDEASRGVDPAGLRPLVRIAAAVANPILICALARFTGGKPIRERRILLGAVAYALPYVAMWTVVGFALGDQIRSA